MVRHGQTGYLCDSDDQLAYYTAKLAYEEEHRMNMAYQARRMLEEELASPEVLWQQWARCFGRAPARDENLVPAAG